MSAVANEENQTGPAPEGPRGAAVAEVAGSGPDAGHYGGPAPVPQSLEVRRRAGIGAVVGVLASAVAIAYLSRAAGGAAPWEWLVALATGLVGAGFLRSCVDARTPLLVADTQGVRIRLGRTWRGLPWGALRTVEHQPRRRVWQDGRLALVPYNPERVLEELDAGGRRQAAVARRLYGEPLAVPLGLSTRVRGAGGDLAEALARLAGPGTEIVAPARPAREQDDGEQQHGEQPYGEQQHGEQPYGEQQHGQQHGDQPGDGVSLSERLPQVDPRPWLARLISDVAEAFRRLERDEEDGGEPEGGGPETAAGAAGAAADSAGHDDPAHREAPGSRAYDAHPGGTGHEPSPEQTALEESERPESPEPTPTPAAAREYRRGRRAEMTSQRGHEATPVEEPAGRELKRPGSVSLVEESRQWGERVRPIATEGHPVEPIAIDDLAVHPAEDPVIGPEIAAARTRLSLNVDQLAARTRIRPHVLEAIEADDFAPCGGDFYARGHLRTVARVLGIDATPLLSAYDDRYADAPIDARRVFEAELATASGGSIRGTRTSPSWSVLVAVVMALVLAWSVARLVTDEPAEVQRQAPSLSQGDGENGDTRLMTADPVSVQVRAIETGAEVTVRNGDGEVVFSGPLAIGESREMRVAPPVRVRADEAGVVAVRVAGEARGRVGDEDSPGRRTFVP